MPHGSSTLAACASSKAREECAGTLALGTVRMGCLLWRA